MPGANGPPSAEAARSLATPSSGATWARPPRRSAASAQAVVGELPDWEGLREAGRAIKDARRSATSTLTWSSSRRAVSGAGGHGPLGARRRRGQRDRRPDRRARTAPTRSSRSSRSTTDEIGLNEALAAAGVAAIETDLAELIIQLAGERPSHILVPAIHKNRAEIRDLFAPRARRAPT